MITLAGIIIINNYGDEIKNYAINNLNKELEVKVEIKNIKLSFFRKFPFISMVLSDVISYSNNNFIQSDFNISEPQILFSSNEIFIQFNLIDILRGNYKIKRIIAEEGNLNLLSDSLGNINYALFKKSSPGLKNKQNIELEYFKLKDFNFLIINKFKNLEIKGNAEDLILKGKFKKSEFDLSTSGILFFDEVSRDGILYAKNTALSSKLKFSAVDSVFTIEKGILNFDDIRLEASGMITSGDVFKTDIIINGKNIQIRSLLKKLPDNFSQWTKTFPADGKLDIQFSAEGNYSTTENPLLTTSFTVNRASIKSHKWKAHSGNISFSGLYSNGDARQPKTSYLSIDNVNIRLNESFLTGNLIIRNFLSPDLNSRLKGKINTSDINYFLPGDPVSFQSGTIDFNFITNSGFESFKNLTFSNILLTALSGSLNLKEIHVSYNDNYPPITDLNGNITLKNDSWLSEVKFNSGISYYSYKGTIDHVFRRFTLKSGSLWLQGDLYSPDADISFLFNDDSKVDEKNALKLPDKLFLKLKIIFDHFKLNNFSADNIVTDIAFKPGFISVSSLNLSTMKGKLEGYGGLIQDLDGGLILKTDCQLDKIDMKELFEVFNNFQQKFIISNNVEGRISGSVNFSAKLKSNFEPDMNSINAITNVIIEKGELKEFIPLKNLSRFIELSELEHVKFETLQNNIVIKNEKVFVPEMAINSSAFKLITSGIHGFDNNFEYKIKVNLSEILAKKAKMKKENDEFAVLEKDGKRLNLFLTITGNLEDFKIRYDKKEAANQIKENLKSEKKELKSILYEEFGLFKKQFSDSSHIKKKEEDISHPKFIFEWDEDENEAKSKADKKQNKNNSNKEKDFKIIWE